MNLKSLALFISICLFASCVQEGGNSGRPLKKYPKNSRPKDVTKSDRDDGNFYSNGYNLRHYVGEYKDSHLDHVGVTPNISESQFQFVSEAFLAKNYGRPYWGLCFPSSKNILLNRDAWNQMGDFQRRALVFHELGHCHLNRRHDNALFKGKKLSLMHWIGKYPDYDNYTWEYDEELFNRDKSHLKQVL